MDLITFSSRSIDPRRRSQVRARKKPNLINCERNAREIDNNGSICLREIGEKSVIAQAWKIRFSPASLERFVPNVCSHVVPIFSDGSRLISNQNAFAKWKHERSGPTLCTLNATKGLTINVNELEHLFVTCIGYFVILFRMLFRGETAHARFLSSLSKYGKRSDSSCDNQTCLSYLIFAQFTWRLQNTCKVDVFPLEYRQSHS